MIGVRIVFVIPQADTSGGIRTVATHARLLSRRGHAVTVVSASPPRPSLAASAKALLRGRGWPGATPRGPSHLDGGEVEHRRIDRPGPVVDRDVPDADVVVATWWRTAEWVAALSPRKGAKVHFVQGDDADLPGQPRARVEATWRLPLRRVVCSRWLLDLARERHGDRSALLVPNGVDLELFSAPARGRQPRPTVGVVYSDLWIKGCDVALEAVRLARRRLPDLRLVAFGHTPVSPLLPLPPRSEYLQLPPPAAIPGLYARCDAWLWPSRREGFGLPLLEAMACRTPVVAAPAGAAPELLAGGGGALLPEADPDEMAAAVEQLLGLPEEAWRAVGERARAVAEGHGWEASTRRFEEALLGAAGREGESIVRGTGDSRSAGHNGID